MKKAVSLITLVLIITLSAGGVFADELINYSIQVGTDNHQPPYSYVNDNGVLKGFYLDIIHAIAIEMGIDIEITPLAWYQIMDDLLATKEIEAVIGINRNENDQNLEYSETILTSSDVIFVRFDNKFIVNLEDLRTVNVAVQKESPAIQFLQNYVDADRIIYTDNQQQGIQMIMTGQVEAFVGDRQSGLYTIQKWKQENFIKIVGEPINETNYSMAFRSEDQALVEVFNTGLLKIKLNGTYDKIYKKWFGDTLDTSYRTTRRILTIFGIVIAMGSIYVVFVLRWNYALKKEVGKRTQALNSVNQRLIEQQKILETNDRFKEEILESMLSGILTVDEERKITFINSRGKEILKPNSFDHIGQYIENTVFSSFFYNMSLDKTLEEGYYYRSQELSIVTQNKVRTFNCNLYPIRSSEGKVMGALLNFRDITEEKELRKELIRKDKMRALGLTIAGLAHEIRNPLTSISTLVNLLPTKLNNEKYREKLLDIVPIEIERINVLITDLLEYSKPKQPSPAQFTVQKFVGSIKPLFMNSIESKNVKLDIDIPDNMTVWADKNQLKQVFINLFLNAIEAVGPEGEITVRSYSEGGKTRIDLTDNGKGISEKALEMIFEPFYTTKSDGTGLGLFISYQIVRENGGIMQVSSEAGKGTTASVILPSTDVEGEY